MSLNNYKLGDSQKAVKKSARRARGKVFCFIQALVSKKQLDSPDMEAANKDFITTYSSNCVVQLNAISRKYV